MTIDTASAGIILDVQNATPGVWKGPRNAVCHLTQGFTSTPIGTWRADDAFSLTGHVKVTPGQDDTLLTLNKWQFGFIQLVRLNFLGFFYAGRTKQEGSVSVLCHIKPALAKAVWLDSDDKYSPGHARNPDFNLLLRRSRAQRATTRLPLQDGTCPTPTPTSRISCFTLSTVEISGACSLQSIPAGRLTIWPTFTGAYVTTCCFAGEAEIRTCAKCILPSTHRRTSKVGPKILTCRRFSPILLVRSTTTSSSRRFNNP